MGEMKPRELIVEWLMGKFDGTETDLTVAVLDAEFRMVDAARARENEACARIAESKKWSKRREIADLIRSRLKQGIGE